MWSSRNISATLYQVPRPKLLTCDTCNSFIIGIEIRKYNKETRRKPWQHDNHIGSYQEEWQNLAVLIRLINVVNQYQVDQNNNSPSWLPYFLSLMVLRIWYTSIYVQMYNVIEITPVLHMCVISRIHGLLLNTYAMLSCEYQGTSHSPIVFSWYTQSPKGSCVYLENSTDLYGIFNN